MTSIDNQFAWQLLVSCSMSMLLLNGHYLKLLMKNGHLQGVVNFSGMTTWSGLALPVPITTIPVALDLTYAIRHKENIQSPIVPYLNRVTALLPLYTRCPCLANSHSRHSASRTVQKCWCVGYYRIDKSKISGYYHCNYIGQKRDT